MRYLIILALMLLPAMAVAKPPLPPYNGWYVTVVFSTKRVKGTLTSCVSGRSTQEATMYARELTYKTIKEPHTVHSIRLVSGGCPKEEKDDNS